MRFLHTSDWHLGRTFHGTSLLDEQRAFVDRLVELTSEAQVELVIIAGDLYDRAIPPTEAVALLDDALHRLRSTGVTVVAITGNHDSATRAGAHDRLLEQAGVSIRGDVRRITEPVVLHPDDGGHPVAIYPVPYLEPSLAGPALAELPGAADDAVADDATRRRLGQHEVTAMATGAIRAHGATSGAVRTVAVAHTFVAGGHRGDSERDLSVGDVDRVHTSVFDGIDYVALGHLHRDQALDGDRVAYPGAPLPYSFSEEGQRKSVRIVELGPDGTCDAEIVPLDVGRSLRTLRGTVAELLGSDAYADAVEARVRFQLTDTDLPMQAMARLQQRFPHAVLLEWTPDGARPTPVDDVVGAVRDAAAPLDLARRFWDDQHTAAADDRQVAVLAAAIDAATGERDR